MEEVASLQSGSQEFCLRWNNFHSSLITALDGFKNDADFVDVTLACEGQFLKAHKMLLSACSVFFRDLLKANPCQHPIVILPPEVRFIDLEKMLRFIYQGEVNVQQENLARFLKTAEMLKIRGLAEDSEKQKVLHSSSPRPPEIGVERSIDIAASPKRPRLSVEGQNNTSSEAPQTPNDDGRQSRSGGDSDSEMLPVKQEMVELKLDCDFDSEVDADILLPEAYLRESPIATTSSNLSLSSQPLKSHPSAPPPPGPLLPSYVPPPQIKAPDGATRSSSQPVGGLIRRFLEECLQLPEPSPLLSSYSGLEGMPHFQLLRSVAKEWSYCRNATVNYSTLGGSSKRQRATSRLIETFESIDGLRENLAQLMHQIIVIEVTEPGTMKKVCKAEQVHAQQHQQQQQQGANGDEILLNREFSFNEIEGVSSSQQDVYLKATEVLKQLRKLYFDQSRRLAVRISQLKKGRQQSHERLQRQQQQQLQQNYLQQIQQQPQQQGQVQHQQGQVQQQQQQQMHQMQQQPQLSAAEISLLPPHAQLSLHLHQPWSD